MLTTRLISRRMILLALVFGSILPGCALSASYGSQGCSLEEGEMIYRRACGSCHDNGAGGAQVIGDREGWRSRIEKGMEQLVRHSIDGYSGAVGHMPPRGGDPALSDAEIAASVCYLVEKSR